ncbi:MAG: hypothetical protein ACRD0X_05365 [Thermoanaerobaculia bacterium]
MPHFERGLALDPTRESAVIPALAECYEEIGEPEKAAAVRERLRRDD